MDQKRLNSKVIQTGCTEHVIGLIQLVQQKGWFDDPIAKGLIAVLSKNKSTYQGLIDNVLSGQEANNLTQFLKSPKAK